MAFSAAFVDVLDILTSVLGEFLDPKSLGRFNCSASMCMVDERMWLASANALHDEPVDIRARLPRHSPRDLARQLSLHWKVEHFHWHEVELKRAIWGGQAPHLFWLEESKLLCIAGAAYPDQVGGATPLPLNNVCIVDIKTGDVEPVEPTGEEHPQIMGAASSFDHTRKQALCFGGGNPQDAQSISNATSAFDLRARRWRRFDIRGEMPNRRQGLQGTVYGEKFYVFAGRELGGECQNDLWAFDLVEETWSEIATTGERPTPRVWYASSHSPYGQWCVCGGTLWKFARSGEEEEQTYRDLYILHFATMVWERVRTTESPPSTAAACLIPMGSRDLLYFGGCRVHLVNPHVLRFRPFTWRRWYPTMMSNMHCFDRRTRAWRRFDGRAPAAEPAAAAEDEDEATEELDDSSEDENYPHPGRRELLRRSHFASTALMSSSDPKVVIYGGSRYFTGEYFHDLFIFDNSGPPATDYDERQVMARGHLGRLRALVRHGYLEQERYNDVLAHLDMMA